MNKVTGTIVSPTIVVADLEHASLWLTVKLAVSRLPCAVDVVSDPAWQPESLLVRSPFEPLLILLGFGARAGDPFFFLRRLKANERLAMFPAVQLVPEQDAEWIGAAYEACANVVVRPPRTPGACVELLDSLGRFWFQCATIPTKILNACHY
jgi:hypothetical protein